jgi:hypothetical protein
MPEESTRTFAIAWRQPPGVADRAPASWRRILSSQLRFKTFEVACDSDPTAGVEDRGEESYLVLQNSSGLGPFFGGPGLVLQFDSPGGAPTVLAACLARPTAMLRDAKTNTLYIAELLTGRIVALELGS